MSDKDVEVLKKKMDQVLFYLHNDEGTGQKGLVAEVKELKVKVDSFITNYDKAQAIKKATIGAWATIGGVVALASKWVGTMIIEHFKF